MSGVSRKTLDKIYQNRIQLLENKNSNFSFTSWGNWKWHILLGIRSLQFILGHQFSWFLMTRAITSQLQRESAFTESNYLLLLFKKRKTEQTGMTARKTIQFYCCNPSCNL